MFDDIGSGITDTYKIFPVSDRILRCVVTKQNKINEPSWFVKRLPSDGSYCEITDSGNKLSADTNVISAVWEGNVLTVCENHRTKFSANVSLREKEMISYDTGGQPAIVQRVNTVDGERNFVKNLAPHVIGKTWEAEIAFDIGENESIYGLGQGEDGIYNRNEQTYYMYQHNMRIPMPFMVSPNGWAVFFDCGCLMQLNKGVMTLDAVQQLDFYVIVGNPDTCIAAYRKLTGKAVLLPKWAFGYIQSKEAYHSQQELLAIADGYRSRNIPLDCIVQDWNTWEPGRWGEKVLDLSRYPDMKAASAKLHAENIHTLVSVWPNMNSGTKDQVEMNNAGKLLYDLATYNAFDEEARALYWKQMDEGLFSNGFDGWWCDSTEPFSGPDWGGETRRSEEERWKIVGKEHCQYLGQERANTYALAHAKGIYEHQTAKTGEKRVVNLTRSGWAGIQNHGTILWSGDICARWDVMRGQIAEGLNMSLSGHPYWTFDIGGFFVVNEAWQKRGCGCNNDPEPKWFWKGGYNDGVNDPAYRELYVRWAQLGCFMPIFRSHGTDTPREIWNFGEEGTPYYDAIAETIRLRYTLMPYIYSLAGSAYLDDSTILRPVFFDYPEAEIAHNSDVFLFGKDILVFPILEPEETAGNRRLCKLPAGSDWYYWYTGERVKGGASIEVFAPLNQIPFFVRAGGVIPCVKGLQYAAQRPTDPVELRIYPGADGAFFYYDDSGDGNAYEDGEHVRIPMIWDDKNRTLTLGDKQGSMSFDELEFAVVLEDLKVLVTYTGKKISVAL